MGQSILNVLYFKLLDEDDPIQKNGKQKIIDGRQMLYNEGTACRFMEHSIKGASPTTIRRSEFF